MASRGRALVSDGACQVVHEFVQSDDHYDGQAGVQELLDRPNECCASESGKRAESRLRKGQEPDLVPSLRSACSLRSDSVVR